MGKACNIHSNNNNNNNSDDGEDLQQRARHAGMPKNTLISGGATRGGELESCTYRCLWILYGMCEMSGSAEERTSVEAPRGVVRSSRVAWILLVYITT